MKMTPREAASAITGFYNSSAPKTERLGQWFLNRFFPTTTDPELFYATDQNKCKQLIFLNYCRMENDETQQTEAL
jgi:hypothetical protein